MVTWKSNSPNSHISMYARTERCYNERVSRTNYVRYSIPHCTNFICTQFFVSTMYVNDRCGLWEPIQTLLLRIWSPLGLLDIRCWISYLIILPPHANTTAAVCDSCLKNISNYSFLDSGKQWSPTQHEKPNDSINHTDQIRRYTWRLMHWGYVSHRVIMNVRVIGLGRGVGEGEWNLKAFVW